MRGHGHGAWEKLGVGIRAMKLYHGSTVCVSRPRLLESSCRLDFGAGLYTASSEAQARKWA